MTVWDKLKRDLKNFDFQNSLIKWSLGVRKTTKKNLSHFGPKTAELRPFWFLALTEGPAGRKLNFKHINQIYGPKLMKIHTCDPWMVRKNIIKENLSFSKNFLLFTFWPQKTHLAQNGGDRSIFGPKLAQGWKIWLKWSLLRHELERSFFGGTS